MEQEIFLAMADKYKDTVYRIALNYFGNSYDAEDTVQDVLMKLYLSGKQFESDEHVRNWLIRVAINACKNAWKMPWRNRNVAFEELSSATFDHPEQSDLFFAVMNLPKKYRIVLYLFYYEDYSVKEIAGMLNLKETAVTILSRSRNQLKQKLSEVWENV